MTEANGVLTNRSKWVFPIVLAQLTVLLAGCSAPGGGSSPTPTLTPDLTATQVSESAALLLAESELTSDQLVRLLLGNAIDDSDFVFQFPYLNLGQISNQGSGASNARVMLDQELSGREQAGEWSGGIRIRIFDDPAAAFEQFRDDQDEPNRTYRESSSQPIGRYTRSGIANPFGGDMLVDDYLVGTLVGKVLITSSAYFSPDWPGGEPEFPSWMVANELNDMAAEHLRALLLVPGTPTPG